MLKMDLEYKEGILFARLKGILNKKSCYKINNYLLPVLKKHNIKYLVYNWKELEMMDNSGMESILNCKYYIKCNKGKMIVSEANKNLEYFSKYLKIPSVQKEMQAYLLKEAI